MARRRSGTLVVGQEPGAWASCGEGVVRIAEGAGVDGQAAAADALAQLVTQLVQSQDSAIEFLAPALRHDPPVFGSRKPAVRELSERFLDKRQRNADLLRDLDDGDPAQDGAEVATLIARGPQAPDEALAFVEVERRDRHAAPPGQLTDAEKAGAIKCLCHRWENAIDLNIG